MNQESYEIRERVEFPSVYFHMKYCPILNDLALRTSEGVASEGSLIDYEAFPRNKCCIFNNFT